MKTMLRMLIFAISVLLPVAALAQKTTYDYDHAQDFSRLKTYAFKDWTKSDNPFVDERIASAIAAQLEARGLRKDTQHPDVYVSARQTFETHQEYIAYNSGYGPYGWGWNSYAIGWGPGYTNVQVENVTVGTLTIDLTDAATAQLVWRGVRMRTVHPMSKSEHVTKRVNHDVEEIFEHFPPTER